MTRHFKRLLGNTSGATAIEYGLIAALISVSAVFAMNSMGTSLNGLFSYVSLQIVIAEAAIPELPQCVEVDSSCNQ